MKNEYVIMHQSFVEQFSFLIIYLAILILSKNYTIHNKILTTNWFLDSKNVNINVDL